jgi:hypothetical protein
MIVFVVRLARTLSNQCLVQKVFSKGKESSTERSMNEEKGRDMCKSSRGREEASLISFFFCSFYCPIWTETAEYTLHGFPYCLYNELTAATIVDNDGIY